uniref:CCHC-type domain-containing protein n=1 Tax=Knipowitschia caucasica TaxID=637954 RepID=A0AAV2KSK7_KNICA
MKARVQQRWRPAVTGDRGADRGADRTATDLTCFKCGLKGHLARACQRRLWCSYCRSTTHRDTTCRRKQRKDRDDAHKASEESAGDQENAFRASEGSAGVDMKGLMVDCGATSHIITDLAKFQRFEAVAGICAPR